MKYLLTVKHNKGFAILFAVTLSAILLAIALGASNVALKEIKFGTSTRSTNEAFFAADTGIECALINDKSTATVFLQSGGAGSVTCLGGAVPLIGSYPSWDFILTGLGNGGRGCAKVNLTRTTNSSTVPPTVITTITSKGYDIGDSLCTSTNLDRTEREIRTMYESGSSSSEPVGASMNVALASSGATVAASSVYNSGYDPSGAINGDRAGSSWGSGGGWNDSTSGSFPDWLEVSFNGTKTINEINVFSVQDSYGSPSTPNSSMTFSQYGVVNFQVQYWDGIAWQNVSGGNITNNNLVWRQVTFSPISTSKIRIYITSAVDGWSRLAEVEAWGN